MPSVLSVEAAGSQQRLLHSEHELIEAVRRRDSRQTGRLVAPWVHRHGLASLERFRCGSLTTTLGQDAASWLQACIAFPGSDAPAQAPGPAPAPASAPIAAAPLSATFTPAQHQVIPDQRPAGETGGPLEPADQAAPPAPAEAEPIPSDLPPAQPQHRRFGLGTLGKVRALVRDCVEEAMGTLHSFPQNAAGAEVEHAEMEHGEVDGRGERPLSDVPFAAAGVAAPDWPAAALQPALAADDPALPPAAAWSQPGPSPLRPELLSAAAASRLAGSPAPAPAALADLRSWLPDAGDDRRRAS